MIAPLFTIIVTFIQDSIFHHIKCRAYKYVVNLPFAISIRVKVVERIIWSIDDF